MDKQQHIHELIDQYLTGELIGQELDKFKIRLKEDPAFLQQVQVQKAIISSIEASRQAELKAMLVASKAKKRRLIIPFGNRSLAVAASILSLLAFGLIIKTMLPNGISELTKNDEPIEQEAAVDSNQEVSTEGPEIVNTDPEVEPDSIDFPQTPEIAVVDDIEETYTDDPKALFENDDNLDLSDLKKDEDEIDGSDFKAKRDSLLGSKNVPLWVVAFETEQNRNDSPVTVTEAKKEGGLFSKKNKDKEEASDKVTSGSSAETKASIKNLGTNIRVEFWESIVNFKGYKFDGSTLLLFDTPVTTSVVIKSYDGSTYLLKNGAYYKLVPNSSFNQMSKVSDATLLKVLNTK